MAQARNLSVLAGNVSSSGVTSVAGGGTGSVTLTANNVLLGNGTSPLQVVAPGTSGNVLQSNGTTWTSAASALPSPGTSGNVLQSNGTTWVSSASNPGYTGVTGQVFTSSGTFTVPTGITRVKATVIGGGGGNGNYYPPFDTNNPSAGAPGGAAIGWITGLTPGTTISVTVGSGGAGRSSTDTNPGYSGGSSSFGSISASGGSGGCGGGVNFTPVSSGSGSGGYSNSYGNGTAPLYITSSSIANGSGTSASFSISGTQGVVLIEW